MYVVMLKTESIKDFNALKKKEEVNYTIIKIKVLMCLFKNSNCYYTI